MPSRPSVLTSARAQGLGSARAAGRSARVLVRAELAASILGIIFVVVAVAIIWLARASLPRDVYVSEMGAPGMPTAGWFQVALVCIACGGALIAWVARGIRSVPRVLRLWAPAISLWIASAFFLIDSQVTCTMGCPLPYGSSFKLQDFVHTLVAVLAFAAACWAMLQTGFAFSNRGLALFSRAAAVAVAVIAGAGGILSLLRFNLNFGSRLELAATTVALVWLAVLGTVLAVRLARSRV
jgi:hypothetical protein